MKSRRFIFITFPIILIVGIYFLGPEPDEPKYSDTMPQVPEISSLDNYIAGKEAKHKLKKNNEARIVWADSTKSKTKYAVVYLHGFSASQEEGNPVHRRFAEKFGCNLYLSRLADHGVDTTEQLMLFTADRAWESAKEALAIGKKLGDKVILMSTSTGGTLALMLAAKYPDQHVAQHRDQ
jgi:pimeloyl-ACP methyl ester carboxylesterase